MTLRASFALGAGKLARWGLVSVLHRNASQLPGRIALALDPGLLSELASHVEGSIVVCGTNGKTTTNNVLASAIEASGQTVMCNRAGANMAPGVTAALMTKPAAQWAVIEADELSTVKILPALKPRYLILLNLFRDQLDRAGEIDRVQDTIAQALDASPDTTLVVCGDDPLSMGVALRLAGNNPIISFGIDEALGLPPDRVPEARFCQVCGAELDYVFRHYAQLGNFACPNGDFARPQLDWRATHVKVERTGVSFDVAGPHTLAAEKPAASPLETPQWPVHLKASFGGVYMVYNLLAAFIGATLAGVTPEQFQDTLDHYHPENGRLQRFDVDSREVVLNLAKNPTGFNQNISLMLADDRPKAAFFVVNDDYNDGKDISWIWDVDFERLSQEDDLALAVGGHRANELQVRMKYAGMDAPLCTDVKGALDHIASLPKDRPLYVLTNYSALWPAKAELEKIGESHER